MPTVESPAKPHVLRRIARDILGTHLSPARTAASLALGLAIGLSPFLGLHTLLAVLLSFALGLNRVASLAGTVVFNPWTAVPIVLGQLRLGATLLGHRHVAIPSLPHSFLDISGFLAALFPHLVDYLVGGAALGAVAGVSSFPLLYYGVRYVSARHIPFLHRR